MDSKDGKEPNQKRSGCCVFGPAFGFCAHPKADQTTFLDVFKPFWFILNLFSDFTPEFHKKRLKMNLDFFLNFCLLFKAGRHAKAGQLHEG